MSTILRITQKYLANNPSRPVDFGKLQASNRVARGASILDRILPSRDVFELMDMLEDGRDKQSSDLVGVIYEAIADKIRLDEQEEQALNLLTACVQRGKGWNLATQRNNIFKAADLLNLPMPSRIFASTRQANTTFTHRLLAEAQLTILVAMKTEDRSGGIPQDAEVWDVGGEAGIYDLTFTSFPFTCKMYYSERIQKIYVSDWSVNLDKKASAWLLRAVSRLLEEKKDPVLATLRASTRMAATLPERQKQAATPSANLEDARNHLWAAKAAVDLALEQMRLNPPSDERVTQQLVQMASNIENMHLELQPLVRSFRNRKMANYRMFAEQVRVSLRKAELTTLQAVVAFQDLLGFVSAQNGQSEPKLREAIQALRGHVDGIHTLLRSVR